MRSKEMKNKQQALVTPFKTLLKYLKLSSDDEHSVKRKVSDVQSSHHLSIHLSPYILLS